MLSHSSAAHWAQGANCQFFQMASCQSTVHCWKSPREFISLQNQKASFHPTSCTEPAHNSWWSSQRKRDRWRDRQIRTQEKKERNRKRRDCFSQFSPFSRLLYSDILHFVNKVFRLYCQFTWTSSVNSWNKIFNLP